MRGAWYFKHDYAAKADQKIMELEMEFGQHVGYSMWFRLLEAMGEAGGTMPKKKLKLYAVTMQVEYEFLMRFITYCIEIDLLKETDECYFNTRFIDEHSKIQNVSEKSSQSAKTRWNKDANADAPADANAKPTLNTKSPKPVVKESLTTESEQITRLRGYAQAIFDELGSCKNKPDLSAEQYQKLIDKWGFDKLVVLQRIYYEWKASLAKKHTHTDFGTLNKKCWVHEKADEKAKDTGKVDRLNPSGRFLDD